jgi:hypothetical protein
MWKFIVYIRGSLTDFIYLFIYLFLFYFFAKGEHFEKCNSRPISFIFLFFDFLQRVNILKNVMLTIASICVETWN